MSPEGLSVRLRRRAPWEAAELGLTLVRENFGAVMWPWLILTFQWAVLCGIITGLGHPFVGMLLFWWPLPLFERSLLHVLSRRAFGPAPTCWETLKAWRGSLRHGWVGALTLWRFAPHRAFLLPVWQLEGLTGQAADRRREALNRQGDKAMWWGIIWAHVELLCYVALLVFLIQVAPIRDPLWRELGDSFLDVESKGELIWPGWFDQLQFWVYAATVILLRPGYVAGGFTLYLNRRMQLEGWDLELAFRRLAARLTRVVAVLALGFLAFGMPMPAGAVEAVPLVEAVEPASAGSDPQQAVKAVLDSPEFEDHVTQKSWQWGDKEEGKEESSRSSFSMPGAGFVVHAVLYVLLAVALVFLVILIINWIKNMGISAPAPAGPSDRPVPVVRGSQAVRADEVFGDVPAEALRLWQAGDHRGALGLLYRGTLHELARRHRLDLGGALTEGECVRLVRSQVAGEAPDYLKKVTLCWQGLAYAHRVPDETLVHALCREWQVHLAVKEALA